MNVDAMSSKELKAVITKAGLKFHDCVEKSDFVARAREAAKVLEEDGAAEAPAEPPPAAGGKIGAFECLVLGPEDPDMVVVILHGFGATNNDCRDIPRAMENLLPRGKKVRYYLPQARTGPQGATQWWTINVMEWAMAMQQRMAGQDKAIGQLIRKEPPGLAECRVEMMHFLAEVCADSGVPHSKLMLAGFSQGAMTALDLALHLPAEKTVAGVTVISGGTIVVDQWAEAVKKHPGLKVLITHGQSDMVLPCVASSWLEVLLKKGGAKVQYELHPGGHDLGGPSIIQKIAAHWAGCGKWQI